MVSSFGRLGFTVSIATFVIPYFIIHRAITFDIPVSDYTSSASAASLHLCEQAPQILAKSDNLTSLLNSTLSELERLRDEASKIRIEKEKLQEAAVNAELRIQTLSTNARSNDAGQLRTRMRVPIGIVEDDFSTGRSCKRVETSWECRDCTTKNGPWKRCPRMEPHSPCEPWPIMGIDEPRPRLSTSQDQHAREDGLRYILERKFHRGAYEQYPCLQLQDCFNMTKCAGEGPLKVYLYPQYAYWEPIVNAFDTQLPEVVRVQDPAEACLLVVASRSFLKKAYKKLIESPYWMGGQNHFMFRAHWILDFDFDIFPGEENFHKAAISGPNFYQGHLRVGYDIPLYYDHPQEPFAVNDTIYDLVQNQPHRPRSLLLSFQGTIKFQTSWIYHRWLATAYWPQNATDILLHVRCPNDNISTPIALTQAPMYDYLSALLNSTFVFCPGGRSPGSWRFGEALAMGAIPVVSTDFLPPFYPEVNWNGCLVRVPEARVVDVPDIVRRIGSEEIVGRQKRCRELFAGLIGWMPCAPRRKCKGGLTRMIDVEQTEFVASMKLWNLRIKGYFDQLERRKQLELDLGMGK